MQVNGWLSYMQEEEFAVPRDLSKKQLQLREAFSLSRTQACWVCTQLFNYVVK